MADQLPDFSSLTLAPGEVLLLRYNKPVTHFEWVQLCEAAKASPLGNRIILVQSDFDVFKVNSGEVPRG